MNFIRALGLRDVVLMNIVAVVGMRWIARGARTGPPSVTLWVLAWIAFFVPLAVACSALARRYPEQGGVYAWVRRAFGQGHGFICGWCLWVNHLFYFPSVRLFGAANFAAMGGAGWESMGAARWYSVAFVLAGIWVAAGVSIIGLRLGEWLQNAGSLGVWIPAGLLIGCGAFAFARFGSATAFTADTMVPRGQLLDTIALWSAMCFAFSGFEITSFIGQEIRDPERTIPRRARLRRHGDLRGADVGPAARRERADLRGQPGRPGGRHARPRWRPLLVVQATSRVNDRIWNSEQRKKL